MPPFGQNNNNRAINGPGRAELPDATGVWLVQLGCRRNRPATARGHALAPRGPVQVVALTGHDAPGALYCPGMTPPRFGRYQLLGLLGRGGMADVFLARAPGVEGVAKRLALKRILPRLAARPGFLELFVVEARIAVELTHANIVPVFDFGRVGGAYFMAMEYVEGRDLGAILARAREADRPLPPALLARVAAEVTRALDYAHRRDVVHRDVAPRNVLVSTEGEVRLGDFGVSVRGDDPGGMLRGTLTYMAPEQARGEAVDGRADLFALGMVLIEALSGKKPRESVDVAVALAQARAAAVPPVPGDAPPALAAIIRRATQPAAADRHATAHEMLEELEAYLRTDPSSARALADTLGGLFDGRPAAPVEPIDDVQGLELADVRAAPEATYLGGELDTLATARVPRGRRTWWMSGGLALSAAAALLAWTRLRTPAPSAPRSPRLAAPVAVAAPSSPRPPPVPPPVPPRPPTRPLSVGSGTLDLNADPWAHVTIDGRAAGDTPLSGLRLHAGTHHVRLANPPLGLVRDIVVEIEAGKKRTELVRLR
jgi:protein kinase-like protein/PEGA domain-containing protein